MDWNTAGAAAATLIVGAGAWLAKRKRRKQAWDGVTERRRKRERLTGHGVVALIEEVGAPMPRNWVTFVDDRVVHKAGNMIAPIVLKLSDVDNDVKATRESVEGLARIMQRLIGRLLPDEPVDS